MSDEPKPMTARIERDVLALRLDLIAAHQCLSRALRLGVIGMIDRATRQVDAARTSLMDAIAPYASFRVEPTVPQTNQRNRAMYSTHKVVIACDKTLCE